MPCDIDWQKAYLNPGEKQCKFCSAKATCPALRAEVTEIVGGSAAASIDEFREFAPEPVDMQTSDNYLPVAMAKVELVEQWCKAVRAEVERRLFAGQQVDGFKLVEGKRGARKWADEADAEKLLKSFRMRQDEMYDFSLISPTKAEKLFKENPKRWAKVKDLITRARASRLWLRPTTSGKRLPFNRSRMISVTYCKLKTEQRILYNGYSHHAQECRSGFPGSGRTPVLR